ncbi:uncharacterized protein LOC134401522 isoform X1 [Elgaria multicarinata webbii]|uniref:uncharacterized protein LOC134401522 isoform X1 n=1 Tax=Elgaria multicarinata webbii TaxID=159646 RepID=UPI002FCD5942
MASGDALEKKMVDKQSSEHRIPDMPNYMVHKEFKREELATYDPKRGLFDHDMKSVWKRDDDDEEENKEKKEKETQVEDFPGCRKEELPAVSPRYPHRKPPSFEEEDPHGGNRRYFPPMAVPPKNEHVNFTKLMSSGYGGEWRREHDEWEENNPQLKGSETSQPKATQTDRSDLNTMASDDVLQKKMVDKQSEHRIPDMPNYMVHKEFKAEDHATYDPKRGPFDYDMKSVWKRDGDDEDDKEKKEKETQVEGSPDRRKVELPAVSPRYPHRKPPSFEEEDPHGGNRRYFPPMAVPPKTEHVNFTKLMSSGYGGEWHKKHDAWEEKNLQLDDSETSQPESTQPDNE